MSLKVNYKDDMFSGKRKYRVTQNADGTISLDDVTNYAQQGDIFTSNDINATNIEVNKNSQGLVTERNTTNQQISAERSYVDTKIAAERNTTNTQITAERNYVDGKVADINSSINSTNNTVSANSTLIGQIKTVRRFTLTTGGWSGSAPYTQTVTLSGIISADTPIPLIEYPDNVTADQKNQIDKSTNMITSITTNNGSVTVVCKFKKPTINLTIALKGE